MATFVCCAGMKSCRVTTMLMRKTQTTALMRPSMRERSENTRITFTQAPSHPFHVHNIYIVTVMVFDLVLFK